MRNYNSAGDKCTYLNIQNGEAKIGKVITFTETNGDTKQQWAMESISDLAFPRCLNINMNFQNSIYITTYGPSVFNIWPTSSEDTLTLYFGDTSIGKIIYLSRRYNSGDAINIEAYISPGSLQLHIYGRDNDIGKDIGLEQDGGATSIQLQAEPIVLIYFDTYLKRVL